MRADILLYGRKDMGDRRVLPMVLLAIFIGCTFFATSAFAVGGEKEGTILAKKGKATTIAELVAMYDSTGCIDCHEEIHDEWSKSAHSRPVYGTGRTAATLKTALENGVLSWAFSGAEKPEDVKVEHLMGCAKCHLPQLADATDAVAKEFIANIYDLMDAHKNKDKEKFGEIKETLLSLNINCLICHNRMAITHKWTDGYTQVGVVYGSADGEHEDENFPVMKESPIMSESILCGQCHGLGPNFELENPTQCATLYGSYLWAYRGSVGTKTCQKCHMEESGLGHDMQSYRSKVMSDAAVDFKVKAYAAAWRDGSLVTPKAIVEVKMTNQSGHVIPDG